MKRRLTNYGLLGAALAALSLNACKNSENQIEPTSASKEFKKIETAYYAGMEKHETVGGKKGLQTIADQSLIDEIIRKGADNYVNFNARYSSARDISGGYDVGVIPTGQGCPLSSEMIRLFVDNEDGGSNTVENDQPGNTWNSSWQVVPDGNSEIFFCKIDGRLLNNSGGKFSVLKLGNLKPANVSSVNFLYLDCEDDGGTTRFMGYGSINDAQSAQISLPNVVDGAKNLYLYWYVYNNASGTGAFPDVSFEYGVLGDPANAIASSQFRMDDEDSGNANTMSTIEGTNDVFANYHPGIGGYVGGVFQWFTPPHYYGQNSTGYMFEGGQSLTATGPAERFGTRFYLKRVK